MSPFNKKARERAMTTNKKDDNFGIRVSAVAVENLATETVNNKQENL